MPNTLDTFRPKSIDEIRQAFTDWWKENHRSRAPYFHFSRSSPTHNRLRMRSQLARKMKLRLQKNELSCELAGRKFHLLLDDFDVKAELNGPNALVRVQVVAGSGAALRTDARGFARTETLDIYF